MNNLKSLREDAGLTLQALADMYGGTKSHCWALEAGSSMPTLTTAYAICGVLDKSVYDVWPDETVIVEEIIKTNRIVTK